MKRASDESDGSLDGETNALLRALNHLDVLEDVMSPTDVSKSHVLQLRGVLEARRLELAVAEDRWEDAARWRDALRRVNGRCADHEAVFGGSEPGEDGYD